MSIGVVLVTYNRLEKLKIALDCFDKQTVSPEYVLVVNNASSDGTKEFLNNWEKASGAYSKYVINSDSNAGGSGGFYLGLKKALDLPSNWIWVSDDDAYPESDVIEKACEFISNHSDMNISAICSSVINGNSIDYEHRRNLVQEGLNIKSINSIIEDYDKEYFVINAFSYVGSILSKKHLNEVGITIKEYFISSDDTEHSLRLSKTGKILCVPAIKVHHNAIEDGKITWKYYYGIRNHWDMIHRHFPGYVFFLGLIYKRTTLLLKRLLGKNDSTIKMGLAATRDALDGRLGMHSKYKPGWKPN